MSAAGRKRVKAELAKQAELAMSGVFNGVAELAAKESPHGGIKHFARWHLQAFRRELESREAQLSQMYPRARRKP